MEWFTKRFCRLVKLWLPHFTWQRLKDCKNKSPTTVQQWLIPGSFTMTTRRATLPSMSRTTWLNTVFQVETFDASLSILQARYHSIRLLSFLPTQMRKNGITARSFYVQVDLLWLANVTENAALTKKSATLKIINSIYQYC